MKSKRQNDAAQIKGKRAAAVKLLSDPSFLFRVTEAVGAQGIARDDHHALLLFLAAITKNLAKPISILEKRSNWLGTSQLPMAVAQLFPPESVLVRASFSEIVQLPSAAGNILCIDDYQSARDALYLTEITSQEGSPVIFTTTTEDRVSLEDETCFLTVRADGSATQTREVIRAHFQRRHERRMSESDLRVWHEATGMLCKNVPRFRYPDWFVCLADHMPADKPRARVDAARFLSLLEAVALCRSRADGRFTTSPTEIEIDLADYCVAFDILNGVFTSTFAGDDPAFSLARAVWRLNAKWRQPVAVKQLANELGWSLSKIYRYAHQAEKRELVRYQSGSQSWNPDRLIPHTISQPRFLPEPFVIMHNFPDLGGVVSFGSPFGDVGVTTYVKSSA